MYSTELPVRKGSVYNADQLPSSTRPAGELDGQVNTATARTPDPFGGQDVSRAAEELLSDTEDVYSRLHRKLAPVVHVLACLLWASVALDIYNRSLFCWHPILITAGFVGLMSEGILLAVNFRQLEGQRRAAAIQVHAYVQLAALLSIALGFWAIWQNKVSALFPRDFEQARCWFVLPGIHVLDNVFWSTPITPVLVMLAHCINACGH
jgi:Eukaryotic cytochrome b561